LQAVFAGIIAAPSDGSVRGRCRGRLHIGTDL
jgi:hypothetical protein